MPNEEMEILRQKNMELKAELDCIREQVCELSKENERLRRTLSEATTANKSTEKELNFMKGKIVAYENILVAGKNLEMKR